MVSPLQGGWVSAFDSSVESEERFRDLVELSSDWYWEQDENLRFVDTEKSPAGDSSLRSAADYVGKTRWELYADSLTPEQWAAHRRQLEAREEFRNLEFQRRSRDGRMRWVSISGRPIFDAGGRFRGYRGIGHDITERKLFEKALRASEERWRATFEQAAVGMALRGLDGRWLDANQKLCDILGYTREELLALTSVDLTPAAARDEAIFYNERMRRGEIASYSREKQYLRKDGTPVWVTLSVSAVNGPDGRPDHLISVIEDISQRKLAEEALRRSEARFRSLTELSSDWYWEQDEQFRFRHLAGPGASAMARTGDPALYVGKARWEIPDLATLDGDWSAHRALLERHAPFRDLVLQRQMVDGTLRYMAISGEPVFDAGGRFAGYRGVGRDVTAQRRIEQLRALELTVARLFAEIPRAADALKAAVRAICDTEHWDCGRYLWVDETANLLRFGEGWNVAEPDIERYMQDSRGTVYAPGFGIAGTVWQSQQPLWVPDITRDPRVARPALARATGMRGTFAVPVAAEGRTIGVLIFQSHDIREPDAQLLETLRVVGGQIGLFVQRSQAE
ncbi:MAG: PAS domain S-box protein [Pseudomonadota bacterium]